MKLIHETKISPADLVADHLELDESDALELFAAVEANLCNIAFTRKAAEYLAEIIRRYETREIARLEIDF